VTIDDGNSIHTAGAQFQLHKDLLPRGRVVRTSRVARLAWLRKAGVAFSGTFPDSGGPRYITYNRIFSS
jgi:hypothetical protein